MYVHNPWTMPLDVQQQSRRAGPRGRRAAYAALRTHAPA